MKLLIGLLTSMISVSAYALTIVNNTQQNMSGAETIKISGIPSQDGKKEISVDFVNYNSGLQDSGIPQLSFTFQYNDASADLTVYTVNWGDINNVTVKAAKCEIVMNDKSSKQVTFSEQCQ